MLSSLQKISSAKLQLTIFLIMGPPHFPCATLIVPKVTNLLNLINITYVFLTQTHLCVIISKKKKS